MGLTNKQFQGFIRLLKKVADETVEKSEKDPERSREEILADIKSISEILQDMLEDGN